MDSNQDLMKQLETNKAALLDLMRSEDGKKLIALLHAQEGGGNIRRAAGAAAAGNTADITRMISQLMRDPQGAVLISRIKESMNKP